MATRAELAVQMAIVQRLQMSERLKVAKKKRAHQIKAYLQYENLMNKEGNKKSKKNLLKVAKSKARLKLKFPNDILLLEAASRNDLVEVRNLLVSGVNPNAAGVDGLTILHQCCIDNHEEMLKLLVEHGANLNARDDEQWTPLHAASICGRVALCKYLCLHGADLLAVNADGNMPYDLCEDIATLEFIETQMAAKGVTQELIDETRQSRENTMLSDLRMLAAEGGDLEAKGGDGETALHIAACCGYVRVAQFLLDECVAVDIVDNDTWQPIHCAVCWGQLDVADLLLQNGADCHATTYNGITPLDLCDNEELKERILEIVNRLKYHEPSRPQDANPSSLNASTSRSACRRRSSLCEKRGLAQREARDEAQRLGTVLSR